MIFGRFMGLFAKQSSICTVPDSREGCVQLSMCEDIGACVQDGSVESETNTAMKSGCICKMKGELDALHSP